MDKDFYAGFDDQSLRVTRIEPVRIARVLQLKGGSDSGGIWWQALNVKRIYETPEGLIIEVI